MKKWIGIALTLLCVCLLVPSLAVASGQATQGPQQTARAAMTREAPELAALAASGALPPLAERLPKNPYVQAVVDGIGRYGGTLRRVFTGTADRIGLGNVTHEWLVRLDFTGTVVEPNVAESWEISADFTSYTFKLREGMKWSDGSPFTADDIIFYWDYVITDREVFYDGDIPTWYLSPSSGRPAAVTKVDDYRFRMTFDDPYPNLLFNIAANYSLFFHHVGHLKSILPRFAGEAKAQELADAQGFASIKDMLTWKLKYPYMWPEIPTIRAWIPVNSPREERYIWTRNPYYWKVDSAGNQLPYIGEVVHSFVQDRAVANLQALAGQIDFQNRHMDGANLTTFLENQDRENYRVVLGVPGVPGDTTGIGFNLTTEDPVLRSLFNNRDFRIAVSYAMDRDEIVQILGSGIARPYQAASAPLFPFHDESWETAYTEFSPQKAAEHLDRVGLAWDANRQYRLRPDGRRLEVVFDTLDAGAGMAELIVNNLNRVGINAVARVLERNLWDVRKNSNQFQMSGAGWPGNPFTAPYMVAPLDRWSQVWGQHGVWVESNGQEGVEPTGDLAKLAPAWRAVQGARTEAERVVRLQEFYELHRQNLWIVGLTTGGLPPFFIVNDRLMNVPEAPLAQNFMRTPNNLWPWQFYFD